MERFPKRSQARDLSAGRDYIDHVAHDSPTILSVTIPVASELEKGVVVCQGGGIWRNESTGSRIR